MSVIGVTSWTAGVVAGSRRSQAGSLELRDRVVRSQSKGFAVGIVGLARLVAAGTAQASVAVVEDISGRRTATATGTRAAAVGTVFDMVGTVVFSQSRMLYRLCCRSFLAAYSPGRCWLGPGLWGRIRVHDVSFQVLALGQRGSSCSRTCSACQC